jgi:RNA polymerase sigma factor (sigma-70 family)
VRNASRDRPCYTASMGTHAGHGADADEAMMLAYRDGDAGAFDRLYARHKGPVYRYLRRHAAEAADELAQDVWMRVINARTGYDVRARFTTWLYAIAHNRLMDHFRASGRDAARFAASAGDGDADDPFEDQPHPGPRPEQLLERREAAGRILAALGDLPEPQREAFVLQQEGGLSVEEIAAATGVNRETAKSRLRYALAKLRAALADLREEQRT